MNRLMTHVMVGNPDLQGTKRLLQHMIDIGVAAIELQIPFSDPIADGPVLMRANDKALQQHVTADDVFGLLRTIRPGKTKLYVMTYVQPIMHADPDAFFSEALDAGCSGFIVPDLPFDAPETEVYLAKNPRLRKVLVPVLSPGMTAGRLGGVFSALEPELVYLTARAGITGDASAFAGLGADVQRVREYTGATVAVGFGVQTADDVTEVLKSSDLAVVGSALSSALEQSESAALNLLEKLSQAAE